MKSAWRGWIPLAILLFGIAGGAAGQGVVVDKSEIRFSTKQMGANVDGRFKKWTANVVFPPGAAAQSKASFDIELASVDFASAESEGEVKSAAWFDTARFPVARFVSSSVKDLGGDRFEIAGKLTIKGITRDCVVPVVIKKDAAGNRVAEGKFTVKRLDYKIGEGMWADTDTVANDVIVSVRIAFAPGG